MLFYTDQRIDITIDNHFDNPFATAYQKNYLGSITYRYSGNERRLWERAKIEPKNSLDDKICKEVNEVFIQIFKFVKYSVLSSFFTFTF